MEPIQRYHALDALRAAMMLLGIVLHSMASYTASPLGDAWPFKDAHTSAHFNLLIFLIHIFRMPAFFVVAGFFAALLHARGRVRGLVANRAKRVLLPFLIFWIALAAPIGGGFVFAIHRQTGTPLFDIIAANAQTTPINTMHLWFLYYLLLFYAAAIALARAGRRRELRPETCAALTTSAWSPLWWITVTTVTLLPMPYPGIEASTLLLPPLRSLLAYGVFFVYGWLLFTGRAQLERLQRWWWRLPLVGFLFLCGFIYLEVSSPALDTRTLHAVRCVLMAIVTWSLVLGITGAFLRFVRRSRPTITYLSRSAYWVYLVHLPIVIWTAGLLAPAPLHAFVKFSIVLVVTTAASLISYHYAVRGTLIGVLLNGVRAPRTGRAQTNVLGV